VTFRPFRAAFRPLNVTSGPERGVTCTQETWWPAIPASCFHPTFHEEAVIMALRRLSSRLEAGALALGLLTGIAATAAAQQGTISGRVTETGTGRPVADARVIVVGTSLFATTNSEGRYAIRGVPAGTANVRVLRVGFAELRRPATVVAGETATLDFALQEVAVRLQEVVTTAAGERTRAEIGHTVTNVDAAEVTKEAAITNVQDVLAARAPGVLVTSGTQTGGGGRVRIRGNNSLNLSNDPIYVIDGVRMTSNANSSNLFTGGAQPSRVGDLNPDEIEKIEIVKGPSAATLYGTDAANGVVVITTKKGRAGAARWNAYAEGGILQDHSDYPTAYTIRGHSPATPATRRDCNLPQVSAGTCILDSLAAYNLFDDPDATPIGTGNRSQVGINVSGGTETVRYFVSGEREDETGVMKLPAFERRRFLTSGLPIPDFTDRPNALYKYSFRANVNSAVTPRLDLQVTSSLAHVNQRFSPESNATVGIGSQAFGGKGYKDFGTVGGGLGTPLTGYRAWTPGYTWQEVVAQRVNRAIGSISANWRPTSWMQNRADVGLDYTGRIDDNLLRRGQGPPINNTYRLGFKDAGRGQIRNFTFNLGSTGSWNLTQALNSKTTVGAQYVNYKLERNAAIAEDLPPGTQTPNDGAIKDAAEATVLQRTLGIFVEEALSFRERLFLTAAVRTDQNSAFGTDFQRVFYPKASLSWIASDESFFPRPSWLDQLRLRAAYGASGVQPGPNDAVRFFGGTTVNVNLVDLPGVVYDEPGNTELQPERSTEIEAGFDTRLFNNRVNFEVTYYSKITEDALIDAIVPPSAGSAIDVRRNLGSVKNAGLELLLNSQILDRPWLGFDLTLTGSINDNKLVDMGGVPDQVFTTWRAVAGYPLFGFWERPITGWQDKNGNGILEYNADEALTEVFVGPAGCNTSAALQQNRACDPIFRGYSSPRYQATLVNGFDLLNRALRLTAMFEYRGGHLYYNNTERIRCVSRQNCAGFQNPNASFEDQAMVVATTQHPSRTLDGFFQPGSFVRFRELNATYSLPERFAGRYLRARSASLNFAARNLAIWTEYRGLDPDNDRLAGVSGNSPPEEFQTLGLPSYFIVRLNLGF
jgi:TonB-linked SusC/RagA family outer membrane protein